MAEATSKPIVARWARFAIVAVALFELISPWAISASIPTEPQWREATDFVRSGFEPGDRIVATPRWTSPLVRAELGDLLTLRTASEDDLAGASRLWEVSIRAHSARTDEPAVEAHFGGVRVRRWPVSTDALVFDFVEQVANAEVTWVDGDEVRFCAWRDAPPARGGLGRGPLAPAGRFVCDRRQPWLWVGATVAADLELLPRRCVWQHPAGTEPVRTRFEHVPLGDTLVVEGALDYNNDRREGRSPVLLRVFIDGRLAGELRHRDRTGWTRLEIDTSRFAGSGREVRFETTTPNPAARTFCWSASTRNRQVER
ncbi:MAG: hypothetical protein AAF500_12785 [Myxococcota bacterium]